jgi:hypothetical protein
MIDPTELRALFDRAATLSAAARASFLDSACRDNSALRAEVDRLLAAHDRGGSVLNTRDGEETSGPGDQAPGRAGATSTPASHGAVVSPSPWGDSVVRGIDRVDP